MEIVGVLAGKNKAKDYQIRGIETSIINGGIIEGLEITPVGCEIGKCLILVERTNGQKLLVDFYNTTFKDLTLEPNKKIYIEIPQNNIDDGNTFNTNTDGTGIATITIGDTFPTKNIVKLAETDGIGDIVDLREFINLKGLKRKGLSPNSVFYVDNEGEEHTLGIGETGQILTSNGLTEIPSWQIPSSSEITGVIKSYAGITSPDGYFSCDGQAISRDNYSDLFDIIGTTYGAGDGSTTFNIPNLKGRVVTGFDTAQVEFNAMGKVGGAKTHTLTLAQMPAHNHTINVYASGPQQYGSIPLGNTLSNTTHATSSAGSGSAHNNLQPYITLNYIIKY